MHCHIHTVVEPPHHCTCRHLPAYPTVLLAALSRSWLTPRPDALNETFCQCPGLVFRTNWASSLSGHVWLYRQGRVWGKEVTQYCWLLSPTQMIYWPERTGMKDRDAREWQSERKWVAKGKGKWIGLSNGKASEDHASESGHWFGESLLEPAFLCMVNSWKSLKRTRKWRRAQREGWQKDIL